MGMLLLWWQPCQPEAAIGLAQLEHKDAIVERRKAVAAAYIKKLEPLSE
jgi:dTDP-4-amino-4,6-dideoxygalactose transaminase